MQLMQAACWRWRYRACTCIHQPPLQTLVDICSTKQNSEKGKREYKRKALNEGNYLFSCIPPFSYFSTLFAPPGSSFLPQNEIISFCSSKTVSYFCLYHSGYGTEIYLYKSRRISRAPSQSTASGTVLQHNLPEIQEPPIVPSVSWPWRILPLFFHFWWLWWIVNARIRAAFLWSIPG